MHEESAMKKCSLLLSILITFLAACAPQRVVTPTPKHTSTHTSPPTASPQPTQTLEPTAMPINVTEISLDSCTRIVEAKISSAGILEIVFAGGDGSANPIISEFGFSYSAQQTSSAFWSEDTQTTVPFPLPPDALGPKLSTNHRWILFRRDKGENQSEFWVIAVDGKAEKKLGTVRLDEEMKASYPAGLFSLDYGWIPNTDKFFYEVDVAYGQVPPLIIDRFVLVDANSGKAIIAVANPLEIEIFRFSPDGSQMAILTESELRVLSTQDGQEEYTIHASLNDPTYSPDGKYIIDFIDEGILRIEARVGQQDIIPLKYTIMSTRTEGPSYGPLPDFVWVDNSTLLLTSLNSDKRSIFSLHEHDPAWTFTVWEVDLASRTTHPIQTFSGDPSSAKISSNRKLLAFQKYKGVDTSQTRDLYLADLATGKILETIEGGVFEAWFPDSNKYLYTTGIPYPPPGKGDPGVSDIDIKYYLGQVGGKPILVNWNASGLEPSVWWVDKNRLVMNCKLITFP